MKFLLSGIIFFCWALSIIWLYYTGNNSHLKLIGNVDISYLVLYILMTIACFSGYKTFKMKKNAQQNTWNFFDILIGFALQIVLVSFLYSSIFSSDFVAANPILLIFHIFSLILLPIFLVFLFRAMGATIFFKNTFWKTLPLRFRAPTETALGLAIMSIILFFWAYIGIFHKMFLMTTFIMLTAGSFVGWKQIFYEIKNINIVNKISPLSFKIISTESIFLVLTFVMTVALINALRPFPIGWDDLWVYMNFPKIIAFNESILHGAGMIPWQLVTAIGFAFDNASLAFFINQIGGFLATITLVSSLSLLLHHPNSQKQQLLILPILLGAVYYLMPMTIFQQAKDMKLDPALMFVSITAIMNLIFGIKYFGQKNIEKKHYFLLFFLAGLLTGFAFSIKLTSLILIISAMWFLSYSLLGIGGFIGFIGIFIAIFTGWNLWSQMFVWMPENTINIIIFAIILAIIWYAVAWKQFSKNFFHFFSIFGIFAWGMILIVSPWIGKNFLELQGKNISVTSLLNGNGENQKNGIFTTDYLKIYSPEELAEKQKQHNYSMITASGSSLNEDFARYFGKESGLNNYIKLPINLTLQKNQSWEFTDITYIFLAFVPVSLLFLQTRKKDLQYSEKYDLLWKGGIIFFLILGCISIITTFKGTAINHILGNIQLPIWYGILMCLVGGFLILAHFCLSEANEQEKNIKRILFLLALYGFLFWISAFGVVWYGILIYFLLLAVIGFGVQYMTEYSNEEDANTILLKKIFAYAFFALIGIYIFGSALLHSTTNLAEASYNEYKFRTISETTSIFTYKGEYFQSLLELNTLNHQAVTEGIAEAILATSLRDDFQEEVNKNDYHNPLSLHDYLHKKIRIFASSAYQKVAYKNQIEQEKQAILNEKNLSYAQKSIKISELQQRWNEILKEIDSSAKHAQQMIGILDSIYQKMYNKVLFPSEENSNTHGIYRIGTFFSYFINNNRKRFFDDSLLTNFQTYFYDENPEIVAKRLEKMGMKYLLIDLNAATIDKQESHLAAQKEWRKSLTDRYENLLLTIRNENFELIDTDNLCLRLAIDEFRNGKLADKQDFLNIAGTNYQSFWKNISQEDKMNFCAQRVVALYNSQELYSYFSPLASARNEDEFRQILIDMLTKQSYFALFAVKK